MEVKPPYTRYKCVSVLDIFSGWVNAFATQRETAVATVKTLLCEIIPRFQFPLSVRSDNDLPYFDHISDGQEGLDVTWELHCAHRPQSAGQVKCMNQTTKSALSKLILKNC